MTVNSHTGRTYNTQEGPKEVSTRWGEALKGRSCGAQSKEPGPESKTRIQLARKVPYEAHRNPTGAPKEGQKSQHQVGGSIKRKKLRCPVQGARARVKNADSAREEGPLRGPQEPNRCPKRGPEKSAPGCENQESPEIPAHGPKRVHRDPKLAPRLPGRAHARPTSTHKVPQKKPVSNKRARTTRGQ